jgi:hypothetical protein
MERLEGQIDAACAIHTDREALTTCTRCGTFSCQECLSQSPPGELLCAACISRAATSQLPWDYRDELGWLRAWWKSVGAILLRPGVTFSTAKPDGDIGGSLLFSAVSWFAGCFTTFAVFAVLGALIPSFGGNSEREGSLRAIIVGTYGVMAVMMPLLGIAGTVVMAALEHLLLMLFGKPRGFDTTLRANALSLAPYVLGLIPVCSLYVAPIWVLVVKIFAYKGLHRTTTGVAVLGALALPALSIILGCGFYLLVLAAALAAGGLK